MKLIRFGPSGHEKTGVILADERRIDVSSAFSNFDEAFFATDGLARLAAWVKANVTTAPEVPAAARLGSPIARPSKIICIGFNYRDHAAESGMAEPAEPIVFFNIPHIISYLSGFMTLLPGDVISTGTPAGVGLGFNPPQYLKVGDVIELGIDGLGSQRQVTERYVEL